MTIAVGDTLPDVTFMVPGADGPVKKTTAEIFGGRKVVLFAVPGAFTPTCHMNHLPGFVDNVDAILAKGVDSVACTAVNDVFVMGAWAKATGAEGKIEMLADGSGVFASALGLDLDLSSRGLGLRSQRYAMIVDDGIVKSLDVEERPARPPSPARRRCWKSSEGRARPARSP
ncbi:putative peroxiredoxin [Methylobrevis pamukkalensis]|uniref:Glutathione-dependent peroxiredoxin n=1 Tax=Methylobrevis pamukkalensis TaxID=1439726 RepID=A0A1E3GRE2_9HYPH|nr:putative peroxiredoxin [Methylobrevis pamukkalensis]